MTREGLKTEWRRAKLDAKPLDYRFHDNRHTAATGILRATESLKAVHKLLRHSDVSTTAKYAHAQIDDVKDAMESRESPGIDPGLTMANRSSHWQQTVKMSKRQNLPDQRADRAAPRSDAVPLASITLARKQHHGA